DNKYLLKSISINDKDRNILLYQNYVNTKVKVLDENNNIIEKSLFEILKEDIKTDTDKNTLSICVYDLRESNENPPLVLTISAKIKNIKDIENCFEKNLDQENFEVVRKALFHLNFDKEEIANTNYDNLKIKYEDMLAEQRPNFMGQIGKNENYFFEFTRFAVKANSESELIKKVFPIVLAFAFSIMHNWFPLLANKLKETKFFSNTCKKHARTYEIFFRDMVYYKSEQIILENGLDTNLIVYKNLAAVKSINKGLAIINEGIHKLIGRYDEKKINKNEFYYEGNYFINENYYIKSELNSRIGDNIILSVSLYTKESNFMIAAIRVKKTDIFNLENEFANMRDLDIKDKESISNFLNILKQNSSNKCIFEILNFEFYGKFLEKTILNSVYGQNILNMMAFLFLKLEAEFKINFQNIMLFGYIPENYALYFKKHDNKSIAFSSDRNIKIPNYNYKTNLIAFSNKFEGEIANNYKRIQQLILEERMRNDKENNRKSA
ncbi:MAG: hypothetical protein KC589_05670, partial [Nanoarchaeota archaeon]|nr:hypothetical protein [Nanoarchaeota archaeon]